MVGDGYIAFSKPDRQAACWIVHLSAPPNAVERRLMANPLSLPTDAPPELIAMQLLGWSQEVAANCPLLGVHDRLMVGLPKATADHLLKQLACAAKSSGSLQGIWPRRSPSSVARRPASVG